MHTVCVCEQHQNAKVLVAALPEQLDYNNLLSKLVCNLNEKNCMLHSCSQCPDGTKLIDMQLLVNEFIDMFFEKFDLLHRHHFFANAQSAFFPSDTVMILLDFTKNYSFLVQGYHWENSQATLHPFCCYYKEKRFLNA